LRIDCELKNNETTVNKFSVAAYPESVINANRVCFAVVKFESKVEMCSVERTVPFIVHH
jgi:hypothetical protein